jgi:hypothetical protein
VFIGTKIEEMTSRKREKNFFSTTDRSFKWLISFSSQHNSIGVILIVFFIMLNNKKMEEKKDLSDHPICLDLK